MVVAAGKGKGLARDACLPCNSEPARGQQCCQPRQWQHVTAAAWLDGWAHTVGVDPQLVGPSCAVQELVHPRTQFGPHLHHAWRRHM